MTANQVTDGRFVFRLYEPFISGGDQTKNAINQGGKMPTWFRTLSLLYLSEQFNLETQFKKTKCPGYEQ